MINLGCNSLLVMASEDVSNSTSSQEVIDSGNGENEVDGEFDESTSINSDGKESTKKTEGDENPESEEESVIDQEKNDTNITAGNNSNEENNSINENENSELINYITVDQPYLETPQDEKIVISFGNVPLETSNEQIVLTKNDGTQILVNLQNRDSELYLFQYSFNDSDTGIYTVTEFRYDLNGERKIIYLEDIGIKTVFGVNEYYSDYVDLNSDLTEAVVDVEANNVSETKTEIMTALSETSKSIATAAVSVYSDNTTSKSKNVVVVLDPGHGGSDPGTSGYGLYEKDINLKIAKYCKQELEEYAGITVYLTREDDTYLTLSERVNKAKNWGADAFVSIHINSATSSSANGAEVWYPNSSYNSSVHEEGMALSQSILDRLVALGLSDRGIKYLNSSSQYYPDGSIADYYTVINNSKLNGFPGIIVEHAFVSNSSDAAKLAQDSFLQQLGIADATGIASYFGIQKIDYTPVFDYEFYLDRYPEIAEVYGYSEEAALEHFIQFGMSEGRQGNANFNVTSYKNRYQDLRIAFEDDLPSYYIHYITTGRFEGRQAIGNVELVPITTYDGVDYSPVYNFRFYIERYPDIQSIYEDNDAGAIRHFVEQGMTEGRIASEDFSVEVYKNKFSDLRELFKDNLVEYYLHYLNQGIKENRTARLDEEVAPPSDNETSKPSAQITIYNGVDYILVYDYDYYIMNNPDVEKIYGDDPQAVLEHFVLCGMSEGRRGNEEFDVTSYKNRYQDLRIAFENDLKSYYNHYIFLGKNEGRKASGSVEMTPVTVYNGVDYSAVYDYDFYINRYNDVKTLYKDNDVAALRHFVEFGMKEGRCASESFVVETYKNKYPDLRNAFRKELTSYYIHYMQQGIKEGRTATGTSELIGFITELNGIDYSSVYNFEYYIEHYSDIQKIYAQDDIGALEHFVEFGMKEGRQASEEFSVDAYKNNYADLRNAYGNNNILYYMHYIQWGKTENRNAKTYIYNMIMGNSNTTVEQMVRYYNSKAIYPTYYKNSDAPTIEIFCQIYMQECGYEGVRAEVAFSQAMKETGFLRYGGDVKIEQFNFAGLGATGGVPGNSFSSVREGIRAQVQHLKAYASTEGLNNECVDPRYQYVSKGCAPYVEWLGIQENPNHVGWASSPGYGYSIVNDYMKVLLAK